MFEVLRDNSSSTKRAENLNVKKHMHQLSVNAFWKRAKPMLSILLNKALISFRVLVLN